MRAIDEAKPSLPRSMAMERDEDWFGEPALKNLQFASCTPPRFSCTGQPCAHRLDIKSSAQDLFHPFFDLDSSFQHFSEVIALWAPSWEP